MKTFTKVILIIALVFALMGAILLGAGVMVGGSRVAKDGTKLAGNNSAIQNAIDTWSEGFDLLDLFHDVDVETNPNGEDSLTVSTRELKKIDMDTACANFVFKSVDHLDGKVSFSCEARKDKYKVTFELDDEGTVKIRPAKRFAHLNASQTPTVTILCPEDFALSELDMDIASGNVTFEGNAVIHECDIDLAAGNVENKGTFIYKLDVDTAAGNVNIALPTGVMEDWYLVEVDCAVGKLEIDGIEESGFGKHYFAKSGGFKYKEIHVDCAAGNVTINFDGKGL